MLDSFTQMLNDPRSPLAYDFSYSHRPLLIAFGGIQGALGLPPFEFFNFTKSMQTNKLYVRDLEQSWYHSGLSPYTRNIEETIAFLRTKISESTSSKIIMVGNSMGGYAALLFGLAVNAERILAFSPQTFIDKWHRKLFWDRRWPHRIKAAQQIAPRHYLDLKPLCKSNLKPDINIFFGETNRLDKIHAKRLSHCDNIKLHPYKEGGHSVVKVLRDNGTLSKLIHESIA
jgi:hypothetical protein